MQKCLISLIIREIQKKKKNEITLHSTIVAKILFRMTILSAERAEQLEFYVFPVGKENGAGP